MLKIWIVEQGDGGDFQERDSAWTDRDDAFKRYSEMVTSGMSRSGFKVIAEDDNPGDDLQVTDRHGNWIAMNGMDVKEKGGK